MNRRAEATLEWRRFEAGDRVRCPCGQEVFSVVMEGSVTWLRQEPRLGKPAPGGERLKCRGCKRAFWKYTQRADQAVQPRCA